MSRSKFPIKIVEIMIKIDQHVFLPYSQILYDRIHNDRIRRPIFTEPWLIHQNLNLFTNILSLYTKIFYDRIHKYFIRLLIFAGPWLICRDPIIFTNIIVIIWYLCTLMHPLVSNVNIVWVISWLIYQDPTQILFSILFWYCLTKQTGLESSFQILEQW